jgi:hypothetical protein
MGRIPKLLGKNQQIALDIVKQNAHGIPSLEVKDVLVRTHAPIESLMGKGDPVQLEEAIVDPFLSLDLDPQLAAPPRRLPQPSV